MTRLIVEENGKRRAFKVHDGTLTVGSGPEATLKLSAGGVAETHADLVVQDGRATLRPRAGVVAPLLGGVPAHKETAIPSGIPIQIGEARLSFEYEGEAAAPPSATRVAAAAPVKKRPAGVQAARRGAGPSSRGRGEQAGGRTRRERSTSGLPSWLVVVFFLLGAGALVFVGSQLLTSAPPAKMGPKASLARVRKDLDEGRIDAAKDRLDGLPYQDLELATRGEVDELRGLIAAALAQSDLALENMVGTDYLQTQLKNFEEKRLRGDARRPQARVFLKRCDEFERRWPKHPDLDWVARMRKRFTPIAELDQPANLDDVAFEVEALTWANPRDFGQAFALLQTFTDEEVLPDERDAALALLDDLAQQRREWFDDRMQQAKFEHDRGKIGQSVAWLVMLILYTGDGAMADQAAGEMVKFEGIDGWLEAYRRDKPERYVKLKLNTVVGAYIREKGLE